MKRTVKFIAIGIAIAIVCVIAFALLILLFQYLWNWLIPGIIGWRAISYWEALGLFILSKILFKGFSWRGNARSHWGSYRWKKKWEVMSPDDRERFKQKMREKCGWYSPKDSDQANVQ